MRTANLIHPLDAVRLGPRAHPAPAWPQVEQQFAPTAYIRVPDCPTLSAGAAPTNGVRQNWSLGPGWVVGWKATVYGRTATPFGAQLWAASDTLANFWHVQLEVNGHEQSFTDSENRAWTRLGLIHANAQGWVPWLVRIEPGDVWSWSHWLQALAPTTPTRVEIALQYVSDEDLAAQVGGNAPQIDGAAVLSRQLGSRYMIPPLPLASLAAGAESAARRIDFQNGPGRLSAWSGDVRYSHTAAETIYESAGVGPGGSCEVQASWHDGEHLIQNGSGPDWISFWTLFGGRGGRRWQPLCRRFSSGDQLTIRMRNVMADPDHSLILQPEIVLAWSLDRDARARGRA